MPRKEKKDLVPKQGSTKESGKAKESGQAKSSGPTKSSGDDLASRIAAYEKLGAFYLGRPYDTESAETTPVPLLYDSRDLVTHALCVGMTGSGKTGLLISLLEEAAIDQIPALVIDPKGDLANLLLTFPDLQAADFAPWIDPDAAARNSMTPEAYARKEADNWRSGLAHWDEDGDRIARLKAAADFAIYTPGSEAGLQISILSSLDAPPPAVIEDGDLLRERIGTLVSSLLALLDMESDPLQGREHILLSNIFDAAWREGRSLDLASLIQQIQKPPIERIGVMDLESFYPAKERFGLSMAFNNLLGSPGFAAWLRGEPLDVDRLLYTASGKPRVAVISIAHLSDRERMFFVSLLLNQTIGWMRSRPGTTSLRALLCMDEVFGYLPPVADPPSKKPLLTLLKQARSFGLGLVLATQNPVDMDYKALANVGTWFLGRLQTERDKSRLMDGLEGASGGKFDRAQMEKILSQLGNRVFLLHNVHKSEPTLFQTRWTLSYLRGPLTRPEIKLLMDPIKRGGSGVESAGASKGAAGASAAGVAASAAAAGTSTSAGGVSARGAATAGGASTTVGTKTTGTSSTTGTATTSAPSSATTSGAGAPVLPPEVPQRFLPIRSTPKDINYKPSLFAIAVVHYQDTKRGIDHAEELSLLASITEEGPDWYSAETVELKKDELEKEPVPGATYGSLPPPAVKPKTYDTWGKDLGTCLFRTKGYELFSSRALAALSKPGETERDFRIRLSEQGREKRDEQIDVLRQKYGAKFDRLQERIRQAERMREKQAAQASQQQLQTAISAGSAVLGMLFGGRKNITAAVRSAGRTYQEQQDVTHAEENVEALHQQLTDLNTELVGEVDALKERLDAQNSEIETVVIKPKKADIEVRFITLAWIPEKDGEPVWQ